ncbi:hypothetical protein HYH02_009778 [Chlamydomonas schloesseri]|uniref:Uncharacterized protein n=1 Tax=Chlamydomonas schloesseri TaxID=2026947 RepID=A0A835W767_9CHLO|nr:hypothetical protein HYH02_009778 [Chlamydomonas schloesseri]|eukprot:KAG2441985.1 hypothetical protein HYH02_009778 [Chlamydomonas schloesseri]
MSCICISKDDVAQPLARAAPRPPQPGDSGGNDAHGSTPMRPGAPKPRGRVTTAATTTVGSPGAEDVSVSGAAGLAFVTPSGHLNLPPLDFDALSGLAGGGGDAAGGGGVRCPFPAPPAPAGGSGGATAANARGCYMNPRMLPSRPTTVEEGGALGSPGLARGWRGGPAAAAAAALGCKARRQRHYHHNHGHTHHHREAAAGGSGGGDGSNGGGVVSSSPPSRNTTEDGFLTHLAPPPRPAALSPLGTSRGAAGSVTAAAVGAGATPSTPGVDYARPFSGTSSIFSAGVSVSGGAARTGTATGAAALPDLPEGIWSPDGRATSRTLTAGTDASAAAAAADDDGDGGTDDDRRERRWVRRLLTGLRGADGRTRTPSVVVFTRPRPPLSQRVVGQSWWTKIRGWVAAGRLAPGSGGAAATSTAAADAAPFSDADTSVRQRSGPCHPDACATGPVCIAGGSPAPLDSRRSGPGFGAEPGCPDVDCSHHADRCDDTSGRLRRDSSPTARPVAAPLPPPKAAARQQQPRPPLTPSPLQPLSFVEGFGHGHDVSSRECTPIGSAPHPRALAPMPAPHPQLLLQQRPSNPRFGHRPPPAVPLPHPATTTAGTAADADATETVFSPAAARLASEDLSVRGGNAVLLYDGSHHHEQVLAAYGLLQPHRSRGSSPCSTKSAMSSSSCGKPAAGDSDGGGGDTRPCYSRSSSGISAAAAAATVADGCGSLVGAGGSRRGLRACASLRHTPSPPLPPPPEDLTDLDTDAEAEAQEQDAMMASFRPLAQLLTRSPAGQQQPWQQPQQQPPRPAPVRHSGSGAAAATAVAAHAGLAPAGAQSAVAATVPPRPPPVTRLLESAFVVVSAQALPPVPQPQPQPPRGLGRACSERVAADACLWPAGAAASAAAGHASHGAERKGRGGVEDRVRGGLTFRNFLSQKSGGGADADAYVRTTGGGDGAGGGGGGLRATAGMDAKASCADSDSDADCDVPIFDVLQRAAPADGTGRGGRLALLQPPGQQQDICAAAPAGSSALQPEASSPSPLTCTPTKDLGGPGAIEYVGDTLPPRRTRPRRHTDAAGSGSGACGPPSAGPPSGASPILAAGTTTVSGCGPRLTRGGGGGSRRGLLRNGSSGGGTRGSAHGGGGGGGAMGHVWGSGLCDSNVSDGDTQEWLLGDSIAGVTGSSRIVAAAAAATRGGGAPATGAPPAAATAATAAAADWLNGYLPGSLSRNSELILT